MLVIIASADAELVSLMAQLKTAKQELKSATNKIAARINVYNIQKQITSRKIQLLQQKPANQS